MLLQCLVALSTLFYSAVGKIEMGTMPHHLQSMYDDYKTVPGIGNIPQKLIDDYITGMHMWEDAPNRWAPPNLTQPSLTWIQKLQPKPVDLAGGKQRAKRQASFRQRRRIEIRRVPQDDLDRYHRAVMMLKQDTTSAHPNKYEALIRLHNGMQSLSAHGGPGFFPFNRIFLYMFENALDEVDPGVALPYYDFTMDADLDDPMLSPIWTPRYFGTSHGIVKEGPYADWRVPSGPLVRNVGGGSLATHNEIQMILRQRSLAQITYPTAKLYNYEFFLQGVCRFIGGNAATLETLAEDPIFFPLMAYGDSLWEQIRQEQLTMGMNPELDYPTNFGSPAHAPNELMGLGQFRNIDGLSQFFSDIIKYDYINSCRRDRDCGSPHLRCSNRFKRCVSIAMSASGSCSTRGLHDPIQNRFTLDGQGDVNQFAYFAVSFVTRRSPERRKYDTYSIANGAARYDNDVFSPFGYTATRNLGIDASRAASGWRNIRRGSCCNGANELYIQSTGLSYTGQFTETVLVDDRYPLSSGIGYVAVKHPGRAQSVALLRAFDSRGRMCSAACKVQGSYPPRYESCNPVVRVSSGAPYMFGNNFGEALMGAWDFSINKDYPIFKEPEIFMRFYCDYTNTWAFEADGRRRSFPSHPGQAISGAVGGAVGGSELHGAHLDHGFGDIHRIVSIGANKCRIDDVCDINRPCSPCQRGTVKCHPVANAGNMHPGTDCASFAECEHGAWGAVRTCGSGYYFNELTGRCTVGMCSVGGVGRGNPMDQIMSTLGMFNPSLLSSLNQGRSRGGSDLMSTLRNAMNGMTLGSGTGLNSGSFLSGPGGSLGSLGSSFGMNGGMLPQSAACDVDSLCAVQPPCKTCKHTEKRACDKTCNWYAECVNGQFIRRPCPPGTHFDPQTFRCAHGESCPRNIVVRHNTIGEAIHQTRNRNQYRGQQSDRNVGLNLASLFRSIG